MIKSISRNSWDTTVKHLARQGVLKEMLTPLQFSNIPSSNLSRWKKEAKDKYLFNDINTIISNESKFIKRVYQSPRTKDTLEKYFILIDSFHEMISNIKGIKTIVKEQKELVINTIELVKDSIPIDKALKVFNISRTTYQNYKTIVIHKCESSYFNWCTKRFPNQLIPGEVKSINNYMNNIEYRFWSKSSVYLRAVRDKQLHCCISTFYKYCRLLGFTNTKKFKNLNVNDSFKTTRPNQVWCADVTIYKTADNIKHYIHILMDHYSKKILGYSIEKSNSGKAIRNLLQEAYLNYKPTETMFLTDGGCENINKDVSSFLESLPNPILHRIAQRDVAFSNSMIEAFNKTLKYEFLYPKIINSGTGLKKVIDESIPIYNNHRPQKSLGGNTPSETFSGAAIDFSKYSTSFAKQKTIRQSYNKASSCKKCI